MLEDRRVKTHHHIYFGDSAHAVHRHVATLELGRHSVGAEINRDFLLLTHEKIGFGPGQAAIDREAEAHVADMDVHGKLSLGA